MKVYGIIMEINPFHNGHLHFLKQAREIAKDNLLVCVISTNIVQRGEISVLSKDIKTKLLLENGVDIVCELPAVLANQGGEYFALNSLKILSNFNITNLVFGSECNNLELLLSQSNELMRGDFKGGINKNLDMLLSNDILGISYIRAAKALNLNIEYNLVKRINNNYNDTSLASNIASATAIRVNIDNREEVAKFLPKQSLDNICKSDQELLFNLFKINLRNFLDSKSKIFLSEDSQLLARMEKVLVTNNPQSLNEFVELCKDRNNSKYKYQRIIICVVLGIMDDDYLKYDYLRILGFKQSVSKYIPQDSFTSLADINNPIAKIEIRMSHLFSMLTNNFQFNEFERKPYIFKERNEF